MTSEASAFLRERHPALAELCGWLADVIAQADPHLVERVYRGWDGIGYRHPEAGFVCAIYPRGDEARLLFEHGRRLPDPAGILRGDGRQTRWIPVTAPDPAAAQTLTAYVRTAVAQRLKLLP